MNAAGRLEIIMQLLQSGLLCKCNKYELIKIDDLVYETIFKEELKHDPDCEGLNRAKELMNEAPK